MQVPRPGILEPEAGPGAAVQRVGNKQAKVQAAKEEGTRSGEWPRTLPPPPPRVEASVGISPPLESSPEEGIPESFRLSCQVSFLQHRLNFLPPACGWQRRNGPCLGSEGAPLLRVSPRNVFSPDRQPNIRVNCTWRQRVILTQKPANEGGHEARSWTGRVVSWLREGEGIRGPGPAAKDVARGKPACCV